MNLPSRLWGSIRAKPGRLLLALAILLAGVDSLLAATALQRLSTARRLAVEVVTLQDSLQQLQRVEQEGLQGLEAQALAEEARLAELRAGFPSLGEPFDLFRRGFTLASLNQVELESIERGSSNVLETPVGLLTTTSYSLHAAGIARFLRAPQLAGLTTWRWTISLARICCDFVIWPAPRPPEEVRGRWQKR
jgi:hypothetical protein